MGGWGENGEIPQTFPVEYLGNGLSHRLRIRPYGFKIRKNSRILYFLKIL